MRALRAMAGAVATAVLVLILTAAPAAAHDELIGSNPTADQQLDAPPPDVQLTFSADVMTIGAAVIVVDASEQDWVDGEPTIQGGVVTTALRAGMPAGDYEIRWRVVSSDGHPISGIVPFAVAGSAPDAAAPTTESSVTATTEATAAATTSDTAAPATSDTDSGQDGGVPRALVVGLIGAVAAVAVFLLVRFLRARNGSSGDPRS